MQGAGIRHPQCQGPSGSSSYAFERTSGLLVADHRTNATAAACILVLRSHPLLTTITGCLVPRPEERAQPQRDSWQSQEQQRAPRSTVTAVLARVRQLERKASFSRVSAALPAPGAGG